MDNVLYKMMINNAREYCGIVDRYNAFIFSEVLSILLCKDKKDILLDIINYKGGRHNVN